MADKKARVLMDCTIDGVPYKSNQIIVADEAIINGAGDNVDKNAEAVKAAGGKEVNHAEMVKALRPELQNEPENKAKSGK